MDIGIARNDEEREATYRFLNAEISAQHSERMEWARGVDTKATLVAGFASAAIPFVLQSRSSLLWGLALAAYGVAFAFAFSALWPRKWEGLKPTALQEDLSEAAPVFVIGEIAGSKVEIYERNERKAHRKVILWASGTVWLGAGVILSVWNVMQGILG